MERKLTLGMVSVLAAMMIIFSLSGNYTSVLAAAPLAAPLCGNGSAPDYGFSQDLQQPNWTVGWQTYASKQAIDEVDAVLDRLNADSIAQTMILILPQEQVGDRVNCAVHFLRYMKLGLPTGERKDNGFVFLIVVEPTRIDVHYGVGLGLPALTAAELTPINRAGEDAYLSSKNMDDALLALVHGFDSVARANYPPLSSPTQAAASNLPAAPSEPIGFLTLCGQLCLGGVFLLFLLWSLTRRGGSIGGFGRSSGGGFPFGRSGGFGGGGGGGGGTSMRGGSGSGRSGRGN